MTDTADIRFLLTIQQNGSLIAASRKLGLTASAVTQRLQQIEKKLGSRLVERTARKLTFTEEGMLLCLRGAELIEQLDTLLEDLRIHHGGLVGTLKVNAPLGFGRRYLAPVIADFQQENPDVDVALTLSDQPLTEAADRFDVVVHIGELRASNLVGHTIAPNARFVCASPAFVKRFGNPEQPDDLAGLPCIVLRENQEDVSLWHFSKGKTGRSVRVTSKLSCNDGDVIRRWACEGRGVILRSEWDVADDIRQGRLVRLLPGWKAPDAHVIALTHNRSGLPRRTRNFMQYLQARFKPLPPWRV
ncbi:HTH-type transcriptional regulator DmlR [Paraburkholderia graminis C4D1M]|jgi:DNA-binding transcriptional LysR family regulator|uniref:Transcriptional regulator, LysR family n=1 Tax=Paraburkholderia graminis (strain ATCC 700544 / DSM 17151 / LMG 18924 / NCIMB 13744 / C4D1M) TaxID=396598 RepID=B1FZ49_PARG4|nr:LysR family transcriptional regulator [Paraburkholderia graminis]EDT11008.1 transcriptional regulator, LysR family [Paraburkholderia graminis C4D1M]CAB3639402.1 HTH-type transcriptional regulator DmlR [Paraburkholderia graminis C4D1M]